MKNLVSVCVVLAILGGLVAYYLKSQSESSKAPSVDTSEVQSDGKGRKGVAEVTRLNSQIPGITDQQFKDALNWIGRTLQIRQFRRKLS